MAVLAGVRARPLLFPPRGIEAPSLPRRRTRPVVRARRRSSQLGVLLGAIALAFALAFASLTQVVRISAAGVDLNRLMNDRVQLEAQRQELLTDLNRLGRGAAIRKQAITFGLDQLAGPLVVQPQ